MDWLFKWLLSHAKAQNWYNEPEGSRWTGQYGPWTVDRGPWKGQHGPLHLERYACEVLDVTTHTARMDIGDGESQLVFLHKSGEDADRYEDSPGFHIRGC